MNKYTCQYCNGQGKVEKDQYVDAPTTWESKSNEFEFGGYSIKCDRCDGEGTINTMTIEDNMALGMADPRNYEEKCPECNGTGKIEMASYIPDNISESEGADEPEYYDETNMPEEEGDYADRKEKETWMTDESKEEGMSKAEEALNKGASAEEIYSLVDTKQSEDDRTQSEDDYLTNLYNKTTANKSAGFSDLR